MIFVLKIIDLLKALYNLVKKDTARSYQSLQVFRLGSVILLSIVLVKLNFKSEHIGDFEWFIFLANVASFFWGMGLKNAFMSFYPKLDSKEKSKLIFSIASLFMLLGMMAFGVLYVIDLPRMDLLYSYLPWLFCFLVLGTTASMAEHILIVEDKSEELFYYGFLSYTTYFLGLSGIAFLYKSIQPLFIGLACWAVFRFIYFLWIAYRQSIFSFDFKLILKFVVFGLPLIVHVLLGAGMEFVDGYLVEAYFERSEFTYYRYGARELPINTILISAMASALIPFAVVNLDSCLSQIKLRTSRLMNYLFPVSMVLMVLSPWIFKYVYSSEFLISAQIFNIYLLIICSRILLPQVIIYAKHRNSLLMLVSIIEFALNISLSLYLMQYFGLMGIAFATVIAFFIQKLILIFYNHIVLKISLNTYLNIPKYIFFTIALYTTFILSTFFL